MGARHIVSMPPLSEEMLSSRQVKALLSVSTATLKSLIANRAISVVRVGRQHPRFVKREILALKAASFRPAIAQETDGGPDVA
jgi:hypothetical protein